MNFNLILRELIKPGFNDAFEFEVLFVNRYKEDEAVLNYCKNRFKHYWLQVLDMQIKDKKTQKETVNFAKKQIELVGEVGEDVEYEEISFRCMQFELSRQLAVELVSFGRIRSETANVLLNFTDSHVEAIISSALDKQNKLILLSASAVASQGAPIPHSMPNNLKTNNQNQG